jgi:hypothetical protein
VGRLNSMIFPRSCEGIHLSSFRKLLGMWNSMIFAILGQSSYASFPGQLVCATCHSHPHWQRTESHGLNFFKSALHTAHERIHINRPPAKLDSPEGAWGRHTAVIRLLGVCWRAGHIWPGGDARRSAIDYGMIRFALKA